MSLASVTAYFTQHGMEQRIITMDHPTATVAEAAVAHNVDPDQIGKTLSFKVNEQPILIVVAGSARIDNKKYKTTFATKAKMLSAEEVVEYTSHIIGGVCPFGLNQDMDVYLDESLRRFDEIIPAAGDPFSSIRLSLDELEKFSQSKAWVDVCKS